MKTLLRCGYVVSGRGCRRADVLIDGEKVEMLGHIPLLFVQKANFWRADQLRDVKRSCVSRRADREKAE